MSRKWLLAGLIAATVPFTAAVAQDSDTDTSTSETSDEELEAYGELLSWDAIWDVFDAAELEAALEDADAVLSSDALGVQTLQSNDVTDIGTGHRVRIRASFNESSGVLTVNQNAGNVNNQANVLAAAFAPGDVGALRLNDADVVQRLEGNSLTTNIDTLTAGIHDSFNDTSGVTGVNQVAGNLNNQANVVALTFGGDAGPAGKLLSEAILAQIGDETSNEFDEQKDTETNATITDSFNNYSGVAQVNQVAGNLNQSANVLGVSVNVKR